MKSSVQHFIVGVLDCSCYCPAGLLVKQGVLAGNAAELCREVRSSVSCRTRVCGNELWEINLKKCDISVFGRCVN